ncbi:basic helix-loop-helix (bHLH) DNA-binding superfamily protein [Actinidia rufa]|uniref:Basic helix-loop-helix (BHLH) DNA-binding superfamily protein n=1 Tax=Actinidia rufa TaxID=165716 RepID=A0A7J0H9E8_9ERIC|nr:basic helix-loop-helix (bHLH) DNA-binding superfamily protein [Actinidia rufa]
MAKKSGRERVATNTGEVGLAGEQIRRHPNPGASPDAKQPVLSMSRLGGAGAVVPLVTDIPISSVEEEGSEGGRNQPAWEKWSNDGTERQVAKLMEENVGAAMQLLQSKALCMMPISLASAIYHTTSGNSHNHRVRSASPFINLKRNSSLCPNAFPAARSSLEIFLSQDFHSCK